MKRKINGLWLAIAMIVGIGWAALLIFWPQVHHMVNAIGIPLARIGRMHQSICAVTGLPIYSYHLVAITPTLFHTIIFTSSALLGIAVFAFLTASAKWKHITIGWFGVYLIAASILAMCTRRTWLGWGYCLVYLAPLGYYLVAFCAISFFTARKWGLAACFSWWMFVLWCGLNISMFPLRDLPKWEMINTPGQIASSIFSVFPAMPASLDKIIIIALNGVLYCMGLYVLLHLSLSRKLVAVGIIVAVVCLAGLLGNSLAYCVATGGWFLVAAALFGWFFIARGDAIDEDTDDPTTPDDVTFVNRVIEQEKFALNPDKTTFFHLEENESWEEEAAKAKPPKSKSSESEIKKSKTEEKPVKVKDANKESAADVVVAKTEEHPAPVEPKSPPSPEATPSPAEPKSKERSAKAVVPEANTEKASKNKAGATVESENQSEKTPAKRRSRGGAKKATAKKNTAK